MNKQKIENQISHINKDIHQCNTKIKQLKNHIEQVTANRNRLLQQLEELKLKPLDPPRISDHALLRYAERVLNFNRESISEQLLTQQVLVMIKTCGPDGTYPADGCSLVLANNVVVTIIPNP